MTATCGRGRRRHGGSAAAVAAAADRADFVTVGAAESDNIADIFTLILPYLGHNPTKTYSL